MSSHLLTKRLTHMNAIIYGLETLSDRGKGFQRFLFVLDSPIRDCETSSIRNLESRTNTTID
jgi:hypothetical protein